MELGFKNLLGKQDLERRIIAFYTLSAMAVTLTFGVMIAVYGAYTLALALVLAAGLNLPVLYLLRHKKYTRRAAYSLLGLGTFTITFSVAFVGGLDGPLVYWISIIPLAGGLILRLRGILIGLSLALLSLLILAFRHHIPGVHDVLVPDRQYLTVSIVCFIAMLGFLAYSFLQTSDLVVADQTRKLDNLLNIVTHDIANPLTLISGHAELLIAQVPASSAHTNALRRIARASELIMDILHKVRQIQAAKAGKLRVETTAVSLAEVFEKLRFIFEEPLAKKQQTLKIDLPRLHQDVLVQAEPVMLLNEVLNNLVSNAIKFSPVGAVIEVTVTRLQDMMRIEIRDQGVGIPKDLLPYIFDDFRSTSRPGTHGETGTGFGLPLARHIVEAFGGSLSVQSRAIEEHRKACGTVFVLKLPVYTEVLPQAQAS